MKLSCKLDDCLNGLISEITMAFFGLVVGTCPKYFSALICH